MCKHLGFVRESFTETALTVSSCPSSEGQAAYLIFSAIEPYRKLLLTPMRYSGR
jgi:hypothetical protein